jgi:hypothetical protein
MFTVSPGFGKQNMHKATRPETEPSTDNGNTDVLETGNQYD